MSGRFRTEQDILRARSLALPTSAKSVLRFSCGPVTCDRLSTAPRQDPSDAGRVSIRRALRKAAMGAGNDVVAPDQPRQPHDTLADEFGMLDDVGGVAGHAGHQHLACR
jgi:hypothetical protein